jgi:hypothetical protein
MDKSQLISTIMNEVKDPELRERLLKEVIVNENKDGSIIYGELEKLGINVDAAKDLGKFYISVQKFVSYIVGGLFFIGGVFFLISNIIYGTTLIGLIFPAIFAFMGLYAIIATRKISKVIQKPNR